MAYFLLKARKKVYHGTSSIFRQYGKSVTDHPGVYCIVGILIAILAIVGIRLVTIDDSLDTVWMEEGSRYIREQKIYVDNFGNLPRNGISAFSNKDGGNVLTKTNLEAMSNVIKTLYGFDSPNSLKMEKVIDGKKVTLTPDDFCERPIIPAIFSPTDPTDPYSYIRRGAYQSYGYVELVKCVRKLNPAIPQLPDGWGISKGPCMRVTVLDCFKEGEADYPDDLKVLQETAYKVGMFMNGGKKSVNSCLNDLELKMKNDMDVLKVPDSAYKAAKERYFLQEFTWLVFTSFGYAWRPSISDFANDEELIEHVTLSLRAPYDNPNYGIENCILDSVLLETPRCCMPWAGVEVGEELYVGQKIYDNDSAVVGYRSFRNPVVAQPHNNPLWVKEMKGKYGVDDLVELEQLVMDWENLTISYLSGLHNGINGSGYEEGGSLAHLKVDLHTDRSTGDMAEDSAAIEMHLLVLGVALLVLYALVVMGSFSNKCINSNILTMVVGMVVSGLAVVGSTGILGYIGVPSISLSMLVMLIGFIYCVGNIYILMFTFNAKLDTDKPVEENMVNTIEYGGHVLFVISATLFSGFICGVYVPIPGFRSVCIQMAAICLLSFLLQMFIFMPTMVWNCKRTQDNRMDCIPIKRQDGKPPKKSFLTETKDLFKNYPTIKHSTTKQSLLSKFASSIFGPIILNKVMRMVILALFIIFFGGSAYVTLEKTTDGLMMSEVAKPGTYQSSFAQLNEEQFEMFSSYVVTVSNRYASQQAQHIDLYKSLAKNDWLLPHPEPKAFDWLADGMSTLTGFSAVMQNEIINQITRATFSEGNQSPFVDKDEALLPAPNEYDFLPTLNGSEPLPNGEFRGRLHEWLSSIGTFSLPALSCVDPSSADLPRADCTDESSALVVARTAIYMRNLTSHKNILDSINAVRKSVDEKQIDDFETFVYGFVFGFWGLYINLKQNLALLCGCILVGVVIPISVFHCSLNAAFLIAVCLIVGLFQVFGSFWVLGVNFNGFSLVPLVLSIVLVVQYSIYVIHSFIGLVNDRKKRARKTLSETFPAIFSGVFTLFLLIVPLSFTAIPFLRSYICFIFLSISFTAFNIPLILLPCILSLMGPRNFDSGCEDGNDSESEDIPPAFIPPLATDDFKQGNNYTRLTLRSEDTALDTLPGRHYEVPAEPDKTTSPI